MSPKTLVAFLAGLVVASGITFFVMRKPQPAAQPTPVQRAVPPERRWWLGAAVRRPARWTC